MIEIQFTALAERQYLALRGPHRKALHTFLDDLSARGCAAIAGAHGYRLSGDTPVNRLCDRHLYGQDRVIVAFESAMTAIVLMIGPHRQGHARDVYTALWVAGGLTVPPDSEITKPGCCDEAGEAPLLPAPEILDLVERCRRLARSLT